MPCPAASELDNAARHGLAATPLLLAHVSDCPACARSLASRVRRSSRDTSSDTVGRFVIAHELGRGAFGVVVEAYDPELDRRVALKLIDAGTAIETVGALIREAQAMARVQHANVVTIYDAGRAQGTAFIAMQQVDGMTLRAWLAAGKRSSAAIVAMVVQAARGLIAIHAAGTVHRDIKPDNILVDGERALLTDFGLASSGEGRADHWSALLDLCAETHADFTVTGSVAGTPAYLAPELFAGASATPASDQYALAVTLWEALAGERPFAGTTLRELVAAQKRPADPRVLERAGAPPRVVRVLERALAVEPSARFASVDAFAQALAPHRRGPRFWAAVATLGLAIVGTAAVLVGRTSSEHALLDARALSAGACQARAASQGDFWSSASRARLLGRLGQNRAVATQIGALDGKLTRLRGEVIGQALEACARGAAADDPVRLCLDDEVAGINRLLADLVTTEPAALSPPTVASASSLSVRSCQDGQAARRMGTTNAADRVRVSAFHDQLNRFGEALDRDDVKAAAAIRTQAEARLAGRPEVEQRYRLALFDTVAARRRGTASEAEVHARIAARDTPADLDPYARALAWVLLHDALANQAKNAEVAVADLAAEQALAQVANPPELVGLFENNRAFYAAVTGDDAGFSRHIQVARQANVDMGDDAGRVAVEMLMAEVAGSRGRLDEAERILDQAEPTVIAWYGASSETHLDLIDSRRLIAQNRGDAPGALVLAERALALTRAGDLPATDLFNSLCGHSDALTRNGRFSEAEAEAREALALAAYPAGDVFDVACRRHLGLALAGRGAFDEAATVLAPLVAIARKNPLPIAAWTLTALAEVELARGKQAEGRRLLAEAIEMCTSLGYTPCVAQASVLLGRALVTARQDAQGGRLLADGLAFASLPPKQRALGLGAQAVMLDRAGQHGQARALAAEASSLARASCQHGKMCEQLAAELTRLLR